MPRVLIRHEDKLTRRYEPSFSDRTLLTERHGQLVEEFASMRGKLEPGDHLKLYEAGYFARGPILEIGRLAGKSTLLMALGNKAAGRADIIYSIELDDKLLPFATESLRKQGVLDQVELIQGDSATAIGQIEATLDIVFVDGDHSELGVERDLAALTPRLGAEAVVMCHDYFHPANEDGTYGVKVAVDRWAPGAGAWFCGRFGGIALFARSSSAE
jgi:predicted O-methyltransferase YrrM